ncbi:MAG: HlyD family secretion protein [Candidatus Melainabacteria bacterium]|nr:HlyD family secretion protein [Candidatus Melainabacteria bacterium]
MTTGTETMTEIEEARPLQKESAGTKVHPELASNKKKNPLAIALASILALGCSIGGYLWWQHASSVEETDDAFISGRVHQLSARVAGTVTELLVDDNQHVKQGTALLRVDPKDLEISLATAKAAAAQAELKTYEVQSNIVANQRQAEAREFEAQSAVASANAGVDKAKAMLSETKLGVALAATAIKQREAELTRCIADFDRYQSLVQDRAATTQSFERARQDKEVAEAGLQAAHEAHKQAKARVHQAMQAVADAQSDVIRAKGAAQSAAAAKAEMEMSKRNLSVQEAAAQKAKSEMNNAQTQLSYTSVIAPVTGRIGHRTVEIGQHIERGQALMSIVSDDKWVVANFKETQLSKMRPGQKVDIKIDAFPNAHITGKVDSISPASGAQFALLPPDNATGNFTKVVQRVPVKIVLDPESLKGYEALLAPGMSVIPTIHLTH